MAKLHFMLLAALIGGATIFGCGGDDESTSGSGGSGNSGASGGSGGGTGGAACTDPATQCPAGSECVDPICDMGACATANVPADTPTAQGQVDGDCMVRVCDGAGATTMANDDTDPADDMNACTADTCDMGTNVHTPIAGPCNDAGGVVCADPAGPKAGQCVGCNTDADCTAPQVCDPVMGSNTCVDPSCTDGSQNGTETDVDCGGTCAPCNNGQLCGVGVDCQSGFCNAGTCAACASDNDCLATDFCDPAANGGTCTPDQVNGAACTSTSQCTSGFCTDGFCCDTACAGTCEACSAAVQGQGADGTCGPIMTGTDPDNDCTADPVASCAQTGECDGAGACEIYAAMTVCTPQSCAGGVLSTPDLCDGAGTCVDSGTMSCGNYVCDAGGLMCLTTCAADTDCVSTAYCAAGACANKLTDGSACAGPNECASNNCVDGVCCNSACTGTCQACDVAGSAGTCSNIPDNADPANECPAAYACNGAGACQVCGDGVMQAGEACDDGNTTNGDGCENNCTLTPLVYTLCVTPNLPITGAGPGAANPSILTIPVSGTILDVDMSIDCAHTWPGDLTFTLSHGGASGAVIDGPGIPASTFGCATDDILATLDDEGSGGPVEDVCAATSPGIASPPSYTPNNPLSAYDGLSMQGDWNLVIDDSYAAGDDGNLNQWCLIITYQ